MISRELSAFLRGSVSTVWAVELLLVLRRQPRKAWTVPELVRELRGSTALVNDSLASFKASGVVQEAEPGRYSYGPASAQLEELCAMLELEYRSRPGTLVRAIVTGSNSKVQGLADAFRFKGTDK